MAFRIVTRRSRVVRRIASGGVAAALVVVGAIAVPTIASASTEGGQAEVVAASPVAASTASDEDPKDGDTEDDGEPAGGTGSIRPGALIDGVCTADFVYTSGDRTFLGSAAHCFADIVDPTIDPDQCLQASFPLGTEIEIAGAENPGTLAYSSWMALQDNGEQPGDMCMYNDFALIEVDEADVQNVDPTVPELGGPSELAADGVAVGDLVYGYLPNIAPPAVKRGIVSEVEPEGLGYTVVTVPTSMPGDSGGGYLDADGRAFGSLSGGSAATSLVTDLAMALGYARDNGDGLEGLDVVPGTSPFSPDGLPMTPIPDAADLSSLGSLADALALG